MVRAKYKKRLQLALFLIISILAVTTVLVKLLEDWTWINSFYFAVVTFTTIGYGDLTPTHPASRLILSVMILCLFGVFLFAFTALSNSLFHAHLHRVKKEVARQIQTDQEKKDLIEQQGKTKKKQTSSARRPSPARTTQQEKKK